MALEKVREILKVADRQNTAVYAFDALDLNTIEAVVQGAERAQKPVIAMLYPAMSDHCSDFDYILAAIREGFTSVMADGSLLPLEENIAFTRQVVRCAKAFDVDVEGELGHVGSGGNAGDYGSDDLYTLPEDARRFAEETEVASLAVAIGSAHGVYVKAPKLSIERLQEIDSATQTPLVLHGGSGIPEDQLVQAFAHGINKFNVGTEFFMLNTQLTHEAPAKADGKRPFGETMYIREGLTDYIEKKISLCKIAL